MVEMKCWFTDVADLAEVRNRIKALPVLFSFAELEAYSWALLESWEPSSSDIPEDAYRGRIFGSNGQVEFRRIDGCYWLAALMPVIYTPEDWQEAHSLMDGEDEDFLLEDNAQGFRKAKIRIYRNTDQQITSAWWMHLVK